MKKNLNLFKVPSIDIDYIHTIFQLLLDFCQSNTRHMVSFLNILVFHSEKGSIHKDIQVSIFHIYQWQVRILYRQESSWCYKHLGWIFSYNLNMDMETLHDTFWNFDGEFCEEEKKIFFSDFNCSLKEEVNFLTLNAKNDASKKTVKSKIAINGNCDLVLLLLRTISNRMCT